MSTITIIDEPCGSGKTTSLIKSFSKDKKYLVIVPYLSEVIRIIEGAKGLFFHQPIDDDCLKSENLELLLLEGKNIATTHQLYSQIVFLARKGLMDDYEIYIDEVPDVCRQVRTKSRVSIDEFYINSGYIELSDSGLVVPTSKWDAQCKVVSDTLDKTIYEYAKSGCLFLLDKTMFMWALPKELLTSGLSITILTYKSEGSMLKAYLNKLGVATVIKTDKIKEQNFILQARELIKVETIKGIEKVNLTFSGQTSSKTSRGIDNTVSNALKNLRNRALSGIPIENIMVTCAKEKWFHAGKDEVKRPKTSGFSKNSKIFNSNWVANTTRGTNEYSHCSHLIYLYDQHMNPYVRRWLNSEDNSLKDDYALTELIQWVWRSRIRRGEPITLYLPSNRMREMFHRWLWN